MDNIYEDYEKVNKNIKDLLNRKTKNCMVIHPHYIYPSAGCIIVPLDDPIGEYQYFLGIRTVLENAMANGSIKKTELPYKAPKYLSDLVKE